MAMYDEIPVPQILQGDTYTHDELLAATPARQVGVTLGRAPAGTTVVLPMGTVIACSTANDDTKGKYYAYAGPSGTNGLDHAEGILRDGAKLTDAADQFGDMVKRPATVTLSKVKGLDAAAIEQLGAVVSLKRNELSL